MTRVPELDGLRGMAILLVIGCHYEPFARLLWGLPKYGWVGVDLFFALSGFLITSVLLNLRGQDSALRQFYARRIRRIIPAYVAFLVILYAVSAGFGDYTLYRKGTLIRNVLFLQSFGNPVDTIRMMISGRTLSLAHIHLGPATILQGPVSNGWGVLWSLSIEEYYYLLWAPVLLWMGGKRAAMIGVLICLVTFATRWLGSAGTGAYFSIFHRFDAPVFGSFVALLMASKTPRRKATAILALAGLVGAATLTVVLGSMVNFWGREVRQDPSFRVFGIPSLSLLAAMVVGISVLKSGSRFLSPLRLPVLRALGRISYMLYLLHSLVYLCFIQFFPPTLLLALAALFCSITLSWASWIYFEKPLLDMPNRVGSRPEKRRVAA